MTESRIQEFIKEFSDPESFLENAEIVEICKLALVGLRTESMFTTRTIAEDWTLPPAAKDAPEVK